MLLSPILRHSPQDFFEFHTFYFCIWTYWAYFLFVRWGRGQASVFCIWISSFPSGMAQNQKKIWIIVDRDRSGKTKHPQCLTELLEEWDPPLLVQTESWYTQFSEKSNVQTIYNTPPLISGKALILWFIFCMTCKDKLS